MVSMGFFAAFGPDCKYTASEADVQYHRDTSVIKLIMQDFNTLRYFFQQKQCYHAHTMSQCDARGMEGVSANTKRTSHDLEGWAVKACLAARLDDT